MAISHNIADLRQAVKPTVQKKAKIGFFEL